MAISNVYADNGDLTVAKKPGVSTVHIDNMPQGGGSGGVTSVNGQTGDVTLTATDVGALPSSTTIPTKTSDLNNDSGYITASQVPVEVETNVGSFELKGDNPIEVRYTAQTSTTVVGAAVPATASVKPDYGPNYKAILSFDLNDFHKAVDAGFNPKLKINQDITGLDSSASNIQVAFASSTTGLAGGYSSTINASSYASQTLDINTILSSSAGTNTYRYLQVGIWRATENTEEGAAALANQMLSKITLEDWPKDVSSTYAEIPNVDQTYNASSTNAQSGTAVADAISTANLVPPVESTSDGKVLKATYSGGVGYYEWGSAGGAQNVIFLTYNASYTAQELLEIYNNAISNTILYCLVRFGTVYTLTTAYSENNNTRFYFTFVSYRNYVSINPTYNNYASGTLDYIHMKYNGNTLSWTAKSSDVALITPNAICGSSEIPANRLPAGEYTQGTVKFLQTVGADSCQVYLWRCKNTTTYSSTFDPLYDSTNWERVSIEQLLSGN